MDSDKIEETCTVQRRDTSVPVRGLSGRAGSPGPSANDCSAPPVGYQAGGGYRATGGGGEEEDGNPFAKRGIPRTPPQQRTRTNSLPDKFRLPGEVEETRDRKRRDREEESQSEVSIDLTEDGTEMPVKKPVKKKREEREKVKHEALTPADLGILITKMVKEARTLRDTVLGNKNTKVEIKACSRSLEAIASKLDSGEAHQAIQTLIAAAEGRIDKDKGSGNSGTPLTRNVPQCKMRTIATQTDQSAWQVRNARSAENIKNKIETSKSIEDFQPLLELKWPDDVFRVVREREGNLLKEDGELNITIIGGEEDLSASGVNKQLGDRFPDLMELTRDQNNKDTVTCVSLEAKILTGDGLINQKRRVVSTVRASEDNRTMYNTLINWRDRMAKLDVKRVAIPVPRADWNRVKKLLEYVLWGTDIVVMAYNYQGRKAKQDKNTDSTRGERKTEVSGPRKIKDRENAIVVSTSGKSYVEALREIKQSIKTEAMGITVKSVRSTRKGELLLTVDSNGQGCGPLKEEITRKLGTLGYSARMGRRARRILHIRGLEATTNTEEVRSAIEAAVAETDLDIKIGELRPAFGNRQNVTVEVGNDIAEKLLNVGILQIGWATCRTAERIQINRCWKCWGPDHQANDCRAPVDRSKACMKCSGQGHVAKDCPNEAYCPLCEMGGHRADTMACAEYQKAVDRVAQKRRRTASRRGGTKENRRAITAQPAHEEDKSKPLTREPLVAGNAEGEEVDDVFAPTSGDASTQLDTEVRVTGVDPGGRVLIQDG